MALLDSRYHVQLSMPYLSARVDLVAHICDQRLCQVFEQRVQQLRIVQHHRLCLHTMSSCTMPIQVIDIHIELALDCMLIHLWVLRGETKQGACHILMLNLCSLACALDACSSYGGKA